jgi:hypothetical protein
MSAYWVQIFLCTGILLRNCRYLTCDDQIFFVNPAYFYGKVLVNSKTIETSTQTEADLLESLFL